MKLLFETRIEEKPEEKQEQGNMGVSYETLYTL